MTTKLSFQTMHNISWWIHRKWWKYFNSYIFYILSMYWLIIYIDLSRYLDLSIQIYWLIQIFDWSIQISDLSRYLTYPYILTYPDILTYPYIDLSRSDHTLISKHGSNYPSFKVLEIPYLSKNKLIKYLYTTHLIYKTL